MTIRVAITHLDAAIHNRRPLVLRYVHPTNDEVAPTEMALQPGETKELCVHRHAMLQVFEAGVGHPDWDPSRPMPATKVEPADLEAAIRNEAYHVLPDTTVTVCVLTLDNGYSVRGESACVDPANFNEAIGREYARKDAINKLWPLLGFRLADRRAGIR